MSVEAEAGGVHIFGEGAVAGGRRPARRSVTVLKGGGETGAVGRSRLADWCELAKPRLSLMVVLTTIIGYIVAPGENLDMARLIHAALGTALAAAGASAMNQVMERRYDALMRRTANRPLPAGRLTFREASVFGVLSALLGVGYLAISTNALTAGLCGLTLITYLLIYTPLKRVTPACTVVGAIPGAIPAMMGWTARTGNVEAGAWVLFGILFAWQMPHFLAIAVMYLRDYATAGFPMLPILDDRRMSEERARRGGVADHDEDGAGASEERRVLPRRNATGRHAIGWCAALIAISIIPSFNGLATPWYAAGAAVIGGAYLSMSVGLSNRGTRAAARRLFVASLIYLPAILTWLVIQRVE